jgi:hypothetical protein
MTTQGWVNQLKREMKFLGITMTQLAEMVEKYEWMFSERTVEAMRLRNKALAKIDRGI